jgi:uncharacterized protein YbjT (DUF2867 family)
MITIIGATGRVGSQIVDRLLAAGKQVRLIARHADKLERFKQKGAEIFVGDSADANFLTEAFKGSEVVLTMIPADFSTADLRTHQDRLGEAQATAIKNSGVKKVVHLSSLGGHTEENTGIISGLARQEKRYNALENVDVLHLRPTYFMENHMSSIGMIKGMGINGGGLASDIPFPMIATNDIAKVASEVLANPDFSGKSVRNLLGPRNYTLNEATAILGKAIGKPDLNYVQFSYDDTKAGMMQMGVSESIVDGYIGMFKGGNEHGIWNAERTSDNTTATTLEEFATTFAAEFNKN